MVFMIDAHMDQDLASCPELFVRPDGKAYFDCAKRALPLRSVDLELQAAAKSWDDSCEEACELARGLFSTLIGATPDDIALVPSAAYGIATVCRLTPLSPGRQVVLMANEHPSNVMGWLQSCELHGAQPLFVPKPPSGEWTSELMQALSERVAVVCFAATHWLDGTFIDSAAVAAQARRLGARVVIDGTQSIGALPFDIAAVLPDFLVASGYKWLLGPAGLSYLYVSPRHHSGIPFENGWGNRVPASGCVQWSGPDLVYPRAYARGARRFDAAGIAKSLLPRLAIPGLRQIHQWTPAFVQEQLRRRNTALAATFPPHFVCKPSPTHGYTHILGIDLGGNDSAPIAESLGRRGIQASLRGNKLRVSSHLWNTAEDIALLRDVLRIALQPLAHRTQQGS